MKNKNLIKIRAIIYALLGNIDRILGRKNRFIILCYHSIGKDNWQFSVSPKMFKEQIEFMQKNYKYVDLKALAKCLDKKSKTNRACFTVTLDDGYRDILEIVPFLKKANINPILFVISDRKNPNRKSIVTNRALLSDSELKRLSKLGWDIGSHGKTHSILTDLTLVELRKELIESKKTLEKLVGKKIDTFSYPHGKYSNVVIEEVKKAGYKIAFSTDDVIYENNIDGYAFPRTGVDGTHTLSEFKYLASPSVLAFRKLVKSTFLGRYV